MLGEIGGILSVIYSLSLVVTRLYAVESMKEHFMTKMYRFKTHSDKGENPYDLQNRAALSRSFSEMGNHSSKK